MNPIKIISLILALASLLSCQQNPVEIYISTAGDDSFPGSKEQPVQSIQRASEIAALQAGSKKVHVLFEDGIFYLPETMVFKPEHSGSPKHPVVYRAVNQGQAVISGGQRLSLEWQEHKKGIYKASLSEDVSIDQLYVNGKRQRMARFPNALEGKNVFDAWDLKHTREPDPGNDPLAPDRIASWKQPEGAYVHANPRYRMVENVFEELDAPGEWFYNKNTRTLYYYPVPDTELETAQVEIVRLKHLIEFQGSKQDPVSFLRLEGLVFRHAARTFMENKEQLLRSDWTTYRGGAIVFNGAEDCMITTCEFDQVGGNSIFVNNYNRRILVRGCYIHHSGANGIAFVGDPDMVRSPLFRYGKQDFENMDRTPGPKGDNYPSDCRVEDCLITKTGRDEKQTSPVQISMSHKITVSHCSIYDVPRAGIKNTVMCLTPSWRPAITAVLIPGAGTVSGHRT
jgi:hypothetical protein